jgi:5-carboxyvanillate decarboxylase
MKMKIIDLEAHFYTRAYLDYLRSRKNYPRQVTEGNVIKLRYNDELWQPRDRLDDQLVELGEGRIAAMSAAGIDMQVISLTNPGVQYFEPEAGITWAKNVNNDLSKVVKKYPDRFIGLAAIAPQKPEESADEIERAITELGLKGVCIQSHERNEYLDNKKYWPIFERAAKFAVPIYIHPIVPSTQILKGYLGYGWQLAGPPLGFGAEVALHCMRLIYSGLFDKCPDLQIVLGHLGEGLPFWMWRLDFYWKKRSGRWQPPINRRPSECLQNNFTVTTSGMFFQPALLCCYLALGADRIGFAVDYPYEKSEEAVQFMKEAPISDIDKEKIFHLNAERLFKL